LKLGKIFESIKKAALHFKGSPSGLSRHLFGKYKNFKNHHFEKVDQNDLTNNKK
jgi:hypothetical protein